MASRTQRAALALLGGLVALGSVVATAGANPLQSRAGSSGACTDDAGITVVVDASAFGDGVHVRCAPQPVRSGLEALSRAGFTFSGTTQFPGLLCRIDGEPASDPCHTAPPADAYWAYWHAPRGGSWTYSTSGAGSRVPPAGSVEGWAFGEKAKPGVAPPDPPPPATTTTTIRRSGSGTGGGEVATSDGSTDGSTAPTAGAGLVPTTSTTTASDPSTTTSRGDLGAGGSDGESGSEVAAPAPVPRDDEGSGGGSPVGAMVGLLAVAGLAFAGVRVARRRASEEELA